MFHLAIGVISLLLLARSVLSAPINSMPQGVQGQSQAKDAAPPLPTPVTQPKNQQGFKIPFTPVPGQGAPLVTVRLNGRLDATFVVDTGTNNCVISQTLVAKLGIKSYPALLPDGKPLLLYGRQPQAVTLTSLQLGGQSGPLIIQLLIMPILIVPDQQLRVSADRLVDGMIGVNLLQNFAIEFEFPGHTMTFCSPGNLTPGQARFLGFNGTGTTLPLSQTAHALFTVPVRMENAGISRQADLLVDTGSQTTDIPRLDAQALSLIPLGQRPQVGFTSRYTANMARLHSLGLGDLRLAELVVGYGEVSDYSPRIGMDILSGYKIMLDFPAKKMYLQPPSVIVPGKGSASPAGK